MPGGILDGRYRLLEKLGDGGVGAVYKAEHLWMRRMVAIKFLHKKVTASMEAVKRFAREARVSGQIQSPNCVSVFDFARAPDGTFYLVMELIAGDDLRSLLQREGRLSVRRAAMIFEQLLYALGAAHAVGVVHRDMKPENVMLQPEPGGGVLVKLLDFGIARRWRAFNDHTSELTSPGRTVGTPEYMAPEQAQGLPLDGRADQYAVGCMLFEALSGRRPYLFEDPIELMRAHVQAPVPRLRDFGLEVPAAMEVVVRRAMDKDPHERFPDAPSFAEALRLAASVAR
jgi:serine/threonine-protein kinase